jgi:hypothetical protein
MSEQHNLELKEKARTYVKEKRWDYLLVNAYLETKYFTSWSKDDEFDFEENTNFGLTNISSEIRTLECGYKKNENNEFLVANFNDIKFKIGGFRDTTYMPDGDAYTTLSVVLLIDEIVVLSIRYSEEADDPYRASDYRLVSVEELHSNKNITNLLEGIENSISKKKEKDNLKRKIHENNSYEGKFTFDENDSTDNEFISDKFTIGEEIQKQTNEQSFKNNDLKENKHKEVIKLLLKLIFYYAIIVCIFLLLIPFIE